MLPDVSLREVRGRWRRSLALLLVFGVYPEAPHRPHRPDGRSGGRARRSARIRSPTSDVQRSRRPSARRRRSHDRRRPTLEFAPILPELILCRRRRSSACSYEAFAAQARAVGAIWRSRSPACSPPRSRRSALWHWDRDRDRAGRAWSAVDRFAVVARAAAAGDRRVRAALRHALLRRDRATVPRASSTRWCCSPPRA